MGKNQQKRKLRRDFKKPTAAPKPAPNQMRIDPSTLPPPPPPTTTPPPLTTPTKPAKPTKPRHRVQRTEGVSIPLLTIISIAAVVVVIAAVAAPFYLWKIWDTNQSDKLGTGKAPEAGVVLYGSGGTHKVDIYVDYHCPVCKRLELELAKNFENWANRGVEIKLHPISILDNYSNGERYSSRAANAAYCVSAYNPDKFNKFSEILYQNQPRQHEAGSPTTDKLAGYADQVGAGDRAEQCIKNEEFAGNVVSSTVAANDKVKNSVPVVYVDGKLLAGFKTFDDLQKGIKDKLNALTGTAE